MPQLVKLQDELRDSGFVIIAPHAQDGTEEQVASIARKNKVNYLVVSSARIPGKSVSGIPAAFLYDSNGKLVGEGHPNALKQKIHELAKSEPHYLAAGRTYTKLKPVVDSLKLSKDYGKILKKLEKDAKGEGETAAEAKYLSQRLTDHGKKRFETAKAAEAEDALGAQQVYSEVATQFKGNDLGDQAAARLKELKADKNFQKEIQAGGLAQQIIADCEKLVAKDEKYDLESSANKAVAMGIRAKAQALKKKFPESKAASKIAASLQPFGFADI
jgi:hypothetical protein